MLAIAANSLNAPSETFIRSHVRNIAPGATVVLCRNGIGAEGFGCPVLSELFPLAEPRNFAERVTNSLRFRWHNYVDPALAGSDERRARVFLQRHGVNVVLAEYGPNGCLLRRVCKRIGVPLYVHFHGYDASTLARHRHVRCQYRRLFRDAEGIIAPSRFLAARVCALGCPTAKINVCPNGLDISEFDQTTAEFGRFVAVGRLVEKKAPHLTISAFSRVVQSFPCATLDIVGDGPLRAECEAKIANLGLGQNVTMHGWRTPDEIKEFLKIAHGFVQHSVTAENGDVESFGISLVEAMACGLPVVTTRHNGFVDTVVNGETGILVEEHDVEGMADALNILLRDPERAARMGRAGRDRVEKNFTTERTVARLREIMGLEC